MSRSIRLCHSTGVDWITDEGTWRQSGLLTEPVFYPNKGETTMPNQDQESEFESTTRLMFDKNIPASEEAYQFIKTAHRAEVVRLLKELNQWNWDRPGAFDVDVREHIDALIAKYGGGE